MPLTNQARGFATWEANHKHIQFRDVGDTGACTKLKHYKARNELRYKQGTSRSGLFDDPCPWQLYISIDDGEAHPKLAAYVINQRTSAFPVDFPRWWEETTRSPAGVVDMGGDPLRRSVMRFQTHLCWYLDATFCYYFNGVRERGINVCCYPAGGGLQGFRAAHIPPMYPRWCC